MENNSLSILEEIEALQFTLTDQEFQIIQPYDQTQGKAVI